MYAIGDRVVHPLHGAGTIAEIVEQTLDDTAEKYYVLQLAYDGCTIFLPVKNCDKLGVRSICSTEEAKQILKKFEQLTDSEAKGWNQRYRDNMDHIRSGNLVEVGQVIKDLATRDRGRGLSAGEQKMFHAAQQIVVSELSYALDLPKEKMEQTIKEKLCLK